MAVTPQNIRNPMQRGAPGQTPVAPHAPAAPQQAGAFSYEKGQLLLARRPRLQAFSCEIIVGLAFLPAAGFGAILLVYVLYCWLFTKVLIYENMIEFRTGILRKVTYAWLYQIKEMWLDRTCRNFLTGDATLHFNVGQKEKPGGLLNASHKKRNSKNDNEAISKSTEIAFFGLGNHHFMQSVFELLRERALEQQHHINGVLTK